MTTATAIEGTCDAHFRGLKEAFAQNFADFGEIGAAVAVMVDGRMVVDLWAGHGYVMNKMIIPPDYFVDPRWRTLVDATYAAL